MRIFVGHRRDCRHLGNQAIGGDHPLIGVVNVGRIVVKGRQCSDHAAHDRHRMRIAAEAVEKAAQLFVHHRVVGDVVDELRLFLCVRQFAIQQQIGDFEKITVLGQLLDRVAAIHQDAFVAVDIGDARPTGGGRHKSRVVGETAGLRIKLADVDDPRPNRPVEDGQLDRFAGFIVRKGHASGRQIVPVHCCTSCCHACGTIPVIRQENNRRSAAWQTFAVAK